MKKVLLLGDSIRLSYNESVKKLLESKAEVRGPQDNCRFARYTLWYINEWLKGGADIVHWNNGIWDSFNISNKFECFSTLDDYLRDLKLILGELRSTERQIIFATTTPVRHILKNDNNERIKRYNAAAVQLMQSEGIPVNDLYSLFEGREDELICDDALHLNDKGVELASKQVAEFIEKYI